LLQWKLNNILVIAKPHFVVSNGYTIIASGVPFFIEGKDKEMVDQSDDQFRKLNRRNFLTCTGLTLVSTNAGMPVPTSAKLDHFVPPEKKLSQTWLNNLFEGTRRSFSGEELNTLGMPCGGLGAGQLYVRGDGTLGHWWIANDAHNTGYGIYDTLSTPVGTYRQAYSTYRPFSPVEQGFAIRVQPNGDRPRVSELSFGGFDDIQFYGEYPVATIDYKSKNIPGLPTSIKLQVFSPFIPLNSDDSSLPLTILRFTLKNTSKISQDVSLAGWLQNAVFAGLRGRIGAEARNRVQHDQLLTSIRMDVIEAAGDRSINRHTTVFEDFEEGWNHRWKASGQAFGSGPVLKGSAGFEKVAGFEESHFVSSRHGGDKSTGSLVSKVFRLTEPYISFLAGGKSYPGETALNLIVEDNIVRTSVGVSRDNLEARYWDVREFIGKEAHLEIIDRRSEPIGHVHFDQVSFTNLPPLGLETFSKNHAQYGEIVLSALDPGATAVAKWTNKQEFLDLLLKSTDLVGPNQAIGRLDDPPRGVILNSFKLQPGEEKEAVFLISWYFPHRRQDNIGAGWGKPVGGTRYVGNMYSNRFKSGLAVARYAAENFENLSKKTLLFRDTYYDTSLPYWFVQRVSMPLANLATETVQWWADGRFWAWEGVGCCFGTCTHVWNYAQGLARVFPELERSVRERQDFSEAQDETTGAIAVRSLRIVGNESRGRTRTATDGHAGSLLKLYREHLMSSNISFLKRNWAKARNALLWLLNEDQNLDGLIEGQQANTYDIAFTGANTFVGALYLAALRAGEKMARLMGEDTFADQLGRIADHGSKASMDRLWNGEYFIQEIESGEFPQSQYGDGCLADQLFGQQWAHQVNLGYLYPKVKVRQALESIWKYNWAPDVASQNRVHKPERVYANPGESGLFMCTWPKRKHPGKRAVRYRNEVWTGIEYQVAAHMLYEGMLKEGLAIIRAVHERYDGLKHNPWNEIECGDHYARALASWGCLLAIEGFHSDGPGKTIGFSPRLAPDNFKGFFTTAQGWGSLVQTRRGQQQTNHIDVKWGRVDLKTLEVELPDRAVFDKVEVSVGSNKIGAETKQHGQTVSLELQPEVTIHENQSLVATFSWT